MKKLHVGAASVVIFGAGIALVIWQQRRITQIQADNAALKNELTRLQQESQTQTDSAKSPESLSQDDLRDLMRLRAQATHMYEVEQENTQLKAERDRLAGQLSQIASGEVQPEPTPEQKLFRVKISFVQTLGMALFMFADDNNGRLPANLIDAMPFMESKTVASARDTYGIKHDQFELTYHGALKDIPTPGRMILMKEKEPTRLTDGRWEKVYFFGDGHAELQVNISGDFSDWENEHTPSETSIPASP